MRRLIKHLFRAAEGTAIWEFAMIFPVLMTLGFAIWEFGRIFDAQLVATNAAREGARYAAAHNFDTSLVADTQTFTFSYLQSGYGNRLKAGGDVTITSGQVTVGFFDKSGNSTTTPQPQGKVVVTVPVEAKVFTTFVPGLKDQITLNGSATMLVQ